MRKLAQALLITVGCFAVNGIFANPSDEISSEVVVSSDDLDSSDNEDPSFCGCGCGKPPKA